MAKKKPAPNKENIVKDLEKVAKKFAHEHPKIANLTRDYYRVHGKFSESAIAGIFGNFAAAVKFINDKSGKISRMDIHVTKQSKNKSGKFFVTAAIEGARMLEGAMHSAEAWAKEEGGEIVLLGMKGIFKDERYDDEISKYRKYFCTEFVFNSNLRAVDMKIHPQAFNPLASMERISNRMTSLIVAHPRQHMNVVPSQEDLHSRIMWTTGSITIPYYAETRSGQFTTHEHVTGGLIIEVKDGDIFHVRQVQFDDYGCFQDKRKIYSPKGVTKIAKTDFGADSMTLGDGHAGWVDPEARAATFEQIAYYKPEAVFIGDMFDGSSISHHNENNRYAKHKLPRELRTLESELHVYAKEIELYTKAFPWLKVYLVFGNHEDHLLRYLREARYVFDGADNHYLALELARYMLDDKNPIEEWCKIRYPHLAKNVIWCKESDYIRRNGVMMTVHGHKGHSGARGSAVALEKSYGKINTGHTHSALIYNGLFTAGTMCVKRMPYTSGSASKWTHSNVINFKPRYKNGLVQRQVLNSFYGEWTTQNG